MPAYNEAGQLASAVSQVVAAAERLGITFEIVLVDDGSRDATPRLVDTLARHDARIRAVHHKTNRGIGAGIATAIQAARGSYFILIPADLAMDLDDLGSYVAAATGADVVAGYTLSRPDYTLYRHAVSWLNGALLRLLFRLPVRNFNYIQLFRMAFLHGITLEFTGSAIVHAELLVRARRRGARIRQIPVRYRPRTSGRSTGARPSLILRTGRDMLRLWLRDVTGRLGS
jgi:glycosyltransferase involved in cell wall biosynthesis